MADFLLLDATDFLLLDSTGDRLLLEEDVAGGPITGVLRQSVDDTRHGQNSVMASQLGGVLVE